MLYLKKIFFTTKLRTKPIYQWLIAVCTTVHILMLNHCSAVLGIHLDLLEKHQTVVGFNPEFIQANITAQLLTCKDISRIQQGEAIGRGTTKEVFGGSYCGKDVAIKMVTPAVKDVRLCLNRRAYRSKEECYEYANYKLMKEIAYRLQLNSDRLVQVWYF